MGIVTETDSYNLPDFAGMTEPQIVAFMVDEAGKQSDRYYWPALNWRIIEAHGQAGLQRIFAEAFGR
mgnify:CR=1 FL=1